MKKLASIAVLLVATVLASCGEEAIPDITGPMGESRIKFFNFSVGNIIDVLPSKRHYGGVKQDSDSEIRFICRPPFLNHVFTKPDL